MLPATDFKQLTVSLREKILEMTCNGRSGHIGCAFSLVEIVAVLYGDILKYDRNDPKFPDRDLIVLSKGHGVLALYAYFSKLGWITKQDVDNYFQDGSRLFGLGEDNIPGIEVGGGSLGHGLAVASGLAWAAKRNSTQQKVFCIVGDGELNEGSIWEAMLFAGHHNLDNLTIIVDANGYQAMGTTHETLDLEPLAKKAESFGFAACECDGHSQEELLKALEGTHKSGRPNFVIAHTVKGKGAKFMENSNEWHYLKVTPEVVERVRKDLYHDVDDATGSNQ